MQVYETEFDIPVVQGHRDLRNYFAAEVKKHIGKDEIPVRFAVTKTDALHYHCEIGVMSGFRDAPIPNPNSIFDFKPRGPENIDNFNVVLLVPTGIGSEIGGHAGDAGPVAKLIASVCDHLITHPNVVNASDINELPENGLYVEGSVISRFLLGTAGLQRVRSNRVLFLMDSHEDQWFMDAAINSLNAARATYGLNCPRILQLDPPVKLKAQYTASGLAAGRVDGMENLIAALEPYRGEYDAIALAGVIQVPLEYHEKYFHSHGEMVNPWGGVEAIYTHAVSMLYDLPSAHSPMLESEEVLELESGVVDARMAAEAVSYTFLQCIFKGLQRSPRIVTDPVAMQASGILTAADVSCMVVPEGAVGLPILAALEQNIPVIAVRENKNLMKNDTAALPWAPGQYMVVENYLEAAGVLCAMKAGIAFEAVRRPLPLAPLTVHSTPEGILKGQEYVGVSDNHA